MPETVKHPFLVFLPQKLSYHHEPLTYNLAGGGWISLGKFHQADLMDSFACYTAIEFFLYTH
jgi:hypothetical protein